jgi:hypothetical protein
LPGKGSAAFLTLQAKIRKFHMGHGKYCPHFAGKLKLAGVFFSLWAVLSFFSFLPLGYYVQLSAYSLATACNDLRAGPPDVVVLAREPRSCDDDDSCTFWDAASELKNIVLKEQPAPEGDYPLSFTFCDPLPAVSRFKLSVLPPRAPPIPL